MSDASGHDFWDYDRPTMTLTGRRTGRTFRLGDRVKVTVVHVDVDRRELDFHFESRVKTAKPERKKSSPAKSEGKRKKSSKRRSTTKKKTVAKTPKAKPKKKSTTRKRNQRRR